MRKTYIDWLRNLGILLLFPYHTGRVFNDYSSFYVKGTENKFSSALIYATAPWFMPLLFLLAGMSSRYALQRRPAGHYARERLLRLFVPFVFGAMVIVPPQAYYAMKFHFDYQGDYTTFLVHYFSDFSDWTELTGVSPAHLWFILFLFLISLILLPLMTWATKRQHSPSWLLGPRVVLLPFVILTATSLLPEIGGQNIFVYGLYFALGFVIATNDAISDAIEHHRKAYLAVALLGIVEILVESFTIGRQSGIAFAACHYLAAWATLLAILGYGKRYLNRESRYMTYFNPAAFPVYIVHQTFLIAAGYYILKVVDHGIVPYLSIMLVTFLLSIAAYEVIRRVKPLGVVFGLK